MARSGNTSFWIELKLIFAMLKTIILLVISENSNPNDTDRNLISVAMILLGMINEVKTPIMGDSR